MKTSLIIDDFLFKKAQEQALKNKQTLSEIISNWARAGYASFQKNKPKKRKAFKTVSLEKSKSIHLDSRSTWMDELE